MSKVISDKMLRLTEGNSAVRAMFEEGRRLAALYGRDKVYDFSLGNPNFPAPDSVKDAIIGVLESDESTMVHGYMSNVGFEDVRSAVAASLNERFGTGFSHDNIIMTVGAAGGLNVILKTLLNPGDEVLALAPFFLEYGNYVSNFDGKLVIAAANTKTFQPSPEAIAEKITPRTKAVILNSPNNPTGVIYSADTIKSIAAVLREKQREYGTSIFIISDEPYRELAYDSAQVPWLTGFYENTVVCYSWSKSLSLPGERIGFLVIPKEIDDFELVWQGASIATRILGFVNAPSLMQRAVAKCLSAKTDIGAYDLNRKLLYKGLSDCGFTCQYPAGAFYMWLKTPCDDKEFAARAKKYNILLVPGSSFACPGYARIAYCVAKSTIENSLPAFRELAGEFGL